jgi:hypothetical protein
VFHHQNRREVTHENKKIVLVKKNCKLTLKTHTSEINVILKWSNALIAQVVVNPNNHTTIWSRPWRPLPSDKYSYLIDNKKIVLVKKNCKLTLKTHTSEINVIIHKWFIDFYSTKKSQHFTFINKITVFIRWEGTSWVVFEINLYFVELFNNPVKLANFMPEICWEMRGERGISQNECICHSSHKKNACFDTSEINVIIHKWFIDFYSTKKSQHFTFINKITVFIRWEGTSWSWSYGSMVVGIYNYLCNQCLWPL